MENPIENATSASSDSTNVKVRVPKRILHFSDGTMEEFSDEEDSPTENVDTVQVDPSTLEWGPWLSHKLWAAGSNTLWLCDSIGESLASTFGITTPKYYFEIEEFKRREAEKQKLQEEKIGWSENANNNVNVELVTSEAQLSPVNATPTTSV